MTCYVHRRDKLDRYVFHDEDDIFQTCEEKDHVGLEYLFRLAFYMEQQLPDGHFKYIITRDMKRLPEYGEHIIALLMCDEWARPPLYAHKVGYVLNTYGYKFQNYLSKPLFSRYNIIKSFKTIWIQYNRIPFLLNYAVKSAIHPARKRLFAIPMGYFKHETVAAKNINDRPIDLHFAGSIYATGEKYTNPLAKFFKKWMTSPRNYARQQLSERLTVFQQKNPGLSIVNRILDGFAKGLNRYEYSLEMMDTKVCLSPRGSSLETYRLFEAMRSGCVVVADKLPQQWFYEGVPALFVEDWNELEGVVAPLLNDPAKLQMLSQQSLAWWKEVASPQAVAKRVVQELISNETSSEKAQIQWA
jgi:Glycosyl transferases group 1